MKCAICGRIRFGNTPPCPTPCPPAGDPFLFGLPPGPVLWAFDELARETAVDLNEAVAAAIRANSTISALVGGRIYPDSALQNDQAPQAVVEAIDEGTPDKEREHG